MVVDNAPCHSNIEEVFSEEEFLGCEALRLGPYSPMFNPIEQVWSLIKAYVKQELAAKNCEYSCNGEKRWLVNYWT